MDVRINVDHEFSYDFQTSSTYKYMKWTFQHINISDSFLRTRSKRVFYSVCRVTALLICWSFFGYNCYADYLYYRPFFSQNVSRFNLIMGIIEQVFFDFRIPGLQLIGFYIMRNYPHLIQTQITALQSIISSTEEAVDVSRDVKKSEREIQDIMALAAVIMLLIPIIFNIILIKRALSYHDAIIDSIILVTFFITIILSMPFLFFIRS